MKARIILWIMIVCMILSACGNETPEPPETQGYEHKDFVSDLPQEDCYLCGNGSDPLTSLYWGEDNVGIINLNTFELLRIEINRYDDHGQLVEEVAGYMQSSSLVGEDTNAHIMAFPDNGYAHVQISGVQYEIDRKTVQKNLCQTCLDTINNMWFSGNAPAEYAIVSFAERTVQPLLASHPWFSAGDYGVDCEFKDDGKIDLLIHYCPARYSQNRSSEPVITETN